MKDQEGLAVLDTETKSAVRCCLCLTLLARRIPNMSYDGIEQGPMQVYLANAWHEGSDGIHRLPNKTKRKVIDDVQAGQMPRFAVRGQQRLFLVWARDRLCAVTGAATSGIDLPTYTELPLRLECYFCGEIQTLDPDTLDVVRTARINYLPPGPIGGGGSDITPALKSVSAELNRCTALFQEGVLPQIGDAALLEVSVAVSAINHVTGGPARVGVRA